MAGPWEKYQNAPASPTEGPWTRYQSAPAAEPQKAPMGAIAASQEGILQGITFGFGDEIMAGMMTPVEMALRAASGEDSGKGIGERISSAYDAGLANQRAKLTQAREEHPVATGIGEAAGGLVTGGQLGKGGVTLLNTAKPTVANMVGRGAAEGAIYGGAYGFGQGEGVEDRINKAAWGGAVGGATGGVLGAVGARGAQRAAEGSVPDSGALKAASGALYKQADDVGLVFKPQSFSQGVDDIAVTVAEAGIDRTIHPRATAALTRLEEAKGQPLTLKQFDILRRVMNAAAKSNEPDERRIASIMIDKLDDYLDNLPASEVISGDPKAASALINNARDLWSRARKGDVLSELTERIQNKKSQFSASGLENATRSEFRNLANRKDFKRMFSKAEQAAIRRVAQGGPVGNALRWIGKLAPTGVVSGAPAGAALYMGEPATAAAIAGAGYLGRAGATAVTNRNAQIADLIVRNGGAMPSAQQLSGPQRAMIDLLMKGSAAQDSRLPELGMALNPLGHTIP